MSSEATSTIHATFGLSARQVEDDLRPHCGDSAVIGPVFRSSDESIDTESVFTDSCQASDSSDESLVARTRDGDREALALFFRRYALLVRTVAQRILRDPAEAEDLLQEVFLFIFRRAALFDPSRGSARSWLVQVTYHRAFDRRRHLMARHFYTNLELEEAVLGSEEPTCAANLYDQTVEGVLGREALARIAAALSEVQQRVLHLYFVEGHTLPEIAALIGQTPANVRNHYYRALEKMRAQVFPAKLQEK